MSKVRTRRKEADATLAAVVAHPVRARALMLLAERTASPNEIAKILGKELNDVAYHVRKLREWKLIEEVDSRPVRGAVEHFYRAILRPWVDAQEYSQLNQAERNGFAREICQLVFADVAAAIESQYFSSRPDNQVVRFPLLVDNEGFEEATKIYDEALDRLLEVQAKCAARLGKSGETSLSIEAVHLMYERDRSSNP